MRRSARVVALLLLVALGGCGTAPAPTPSPTASASSSLPELAGWQQIDLPSDDPTIGYTTAVATGAGFLVAGGSERLSAWVSEDGESWVAEQIPGDNRLPNDAIVWGDRILALGAGEFGPGCAHPHAIDTWVRDSSGTWTHAPFQKAFCAGGTASAAVAGGLIVIVGAGSGDVPYAWSSEDGLHWIDHARAFRQGGLPYGVVATPTGFYAVGTSATGTWVARSPNGAEWTESVRLPGPVEARPLGFSVIGGTLVVVLGAPDGSVGVASSEDGERWVTASADGIASDTIGRIEAMEGGLVAIGGDQQGPALWVSAEGRSWRRVEVPKTGFRGWFTDVAVGHGRAVILGGAEIGGGALEPAAWVGPASLLAP